MRILPSLLISAVFAAPVLAEESRQLDAHEHGVGQLDIAFEGTKVAMSLHAPGADIVGFEYEASSAEDRAAVDAAVATLARPLDLFVLPKAAGCSVVQASAALESEEDDHGEEKHHDDHDDHDDHAKSDDHDDHDDHAETDAAGHTEFHAEYVLNCADNSAIEKISFLYFETFPNAQELEVQIVSESGAQAFEVVRSAPTLDLRDLF